jgi:hypothetical protein
VYSDIQLDSNSISSALILPYTFVRAAYFFRHCLTTFFFACSVYTTDARKRLKLSSESTSACVARLSMNEGKEDYSVPR